VIVRYLLDPPPRYGASNFHPKSPLSSKYIATAFRGMTLAKERFPHCGGPSIFRVAPEADALGGCGADVGGVETGLEPAEAPGGDLGVGDVAAFWKRVMEKPPADCRLARRVSKRAAVRRRSKRRGDGDGGGLSLGKERGRGMQKAEAGGGNRRCARRTGAAILLSVEILSSVHTGDVYTVHICRCDHLVKVGRGLQS
jgi:hypothetical protein